MPTKVKVKVVIFYRSPQSCFKYSSMDACRRVLVYGGKGALGRCIVDYFKANNWVNIYIGGVVSRAFILYGGLATL